MIHRGHVSNPPFGLIALGPLVKVRFHLDPIEAPIRQARGDVVPSAIGGMVMVDTGAQGTHVFESVPRHLGLTPIRYVPVIGVNRQPEDRPVYRMALVIQMADRQGKIVDATFAADMISAPGTFELPAYPERVIGLLGRDFLAHFDFHYHGTTGQFEIVGAEPQGSVRQPDDRDKVKRKRDLTRQARKRNRR